MLIVGIDVARDSHRYAVLDDERSVTEQGEIENRGRTVATWCKRLKQLHPDDQIVVGLERNIRLSLKLEEVAGKHGFEVRQVTPSQVKAFRESVMGEHNKTDVTDAQAIAELLSQNLKRARPIDRPRAAMAQAARHRATLVRQRTRHINALRGAVASYWPEAGCKLFKEISLYILVLFAYKPDPQHVVQAGVAGLLKFFREHGSPVRTSTVQKIVDAAEQCLVDQPAAQGAAHGGPAARSHAVELEADH